MHVNHSVGRSLAASVVFLVFSSATLGKVIYVDDDAAGANDGTNWANAYLCLQDALVGAQLGDEIRVAQGTYRPDQYFSTGRFPRIVASGDRTAAFQLIIGVAIRGGYAGVGEPDPDARDVDSYRTVLSGDLDGDDGPGFANNGENSYRVVTGSGTNETAVLDGFIITAGHANGPAPYDGGSGMLNDHSSPTLVNCTFTGNCSDSGGAMYNDNSNPTLTDCTFSGNTADKGGGAMNNWQSSPTLTNCTFSGNSAGWDGGGMSNGSSHPTLINCVFRENSADEGGGGMHNHEGNPTLLDCTFSGNSTDKGGGGMDNYSSSPTLTDCTFSNNSAGWSGGGMDNVSRDEYTESRPTLTNCTFSGNSAGWVGGGMSNLSSHPTVTNCIFSENSADGNGGGMHNDAGNPTLLNCTFSGNSSLLGGGMYNELGSNPAITDCTFRGNLAEEKGGGIYHDGGNLTLLNCIFIENTSVSNGAAVKLISSDATITGCRFLGNMTLCGGSANAGAIGNSKSSPTINNCTFVNNSCPGFSGGAMVNYRGSNPTVLNCVFQGNSAGAGGGGMFNWVSSSPLVVNCIFAGNSANRGGGMSNNKDCHPTVINCTFAGNRARDTGGGMWSRTGSSAALSNCILWENTGDDGKNMGESAQIDSDETSTVTVNHCDIRGLTGALGGTGNIGDRPLFVDADGADDFIGTEDDDLRLLAGSPCIGAGDNLAIPASVLLDLDGNPRIMNGTVDMGAYEGGVAPSANILYVDADAAGANDGTSWADAYTCLQDALAVASSGDEIHVAQGTYRPDQYFSTGRFPGIAASGDRTATFHLINGVAIRGGYAGVGEPDPDARSVDLYRTILSGDLSGNDRPNFINSAENSYHVVTGSGTDETAMLEGFTITAGHANGPVPYERGSGMYNSRGNPTLTNCTFTGNCCDSGGAMYNDNSNPSLTQCTFRGNSADKGGGAMNNWQSSPTLTHCTFSDNSAGWAGGAIDNVSWDENTESSPIVTDCTFTGNSAGWNGGAIENVSSHPTVTNCIFRENSADSNGGGMSNSDDSRPSVANCTFSGNSAEEKGGGIYSDGGDLTLRNCLFIENTSVSNGAAVKLISSDATISGCRFRENMTLGGSSANAGAIGNSKSSPTITDCTFVNNSCPGFSGGAMVNYTGSDPMVLNCVFQGNSAGAGGGGIFNWVSSSPLVVNCIFAGNSANRGGGMSNNKDCHPSVINCTFVGNRARDAGGGMWSRTGSSAALSNCILWENMDDNGQNVDESAQVDLDGTSAVTINHCDIQGLTRALGGTDNIGAPPLFVDADGADNFIGTEDDNLRLLPGSPCIDAGDNLAIPASVLTDHDGYLRILNGIVDMGAYECGPTSQYLRAGNPSPSDGDMHAYAWVNLSWRAGTLAVSHDVYFGESLDDVNDGAESTFRGNQAETLFVVGLPGYPYPHGLVPNTTYYWRIDAVNDVHPDSPWKGDVWCFSIPSETGYIPKHFEITYYDNYNYDTDEWGAWQSAETPRDAWDDKYAPIDPAKTVFTDHAFTRIETFDLRGDLFSKDGHASAGEDWNPLQSIGDTVSGQSAHHVFAAVFRGLVWLEEGDLLWIASDDDAYVFLDDDTTWGQEVLSVPYISRFGPDSMIVTAAQAGYRLMTVKYMERRNIRSGIEITLNGEHLRSAEVAHVVTGEASRSQ